MEMDTNYSKIDESVVLADILTLVLIIAWLSSINFKLIIALVGWLGPSTISTW